MDLYYHFDLFGSKEEKELFFKLLISPAPHSSQIAATLHGQLILDTHDGQSFIAARITDFDPGDEPTPFTGPLATRANVLGLTLKFCADEVSSQVEHHLFEGDMPRAIGLVVFLNQTGAERLGLPADPQDFNHKQGWVAVSSEFINRRALELAQHYTIKHDPTLTTLGPPTKTLH